MAFPIWHVAQVCARSMDPSGALALAFSVQGECHANTIPLEASMGAWSERALRQYFESRGAIVPSESTRPFVPSSDRVPPAAAAPPPRQLKAPSADGAAAAPRPHQSLRTLPADSWRREHTVRKTHWLCRSCDVAVPREVPACATCHSCDFSQSDLRSDDASLLAARLRACGELRSLNVSHNGLGATGVAVLASALPALPSLTLLDLSATCASDDGAIALVDALNADGTCPRLQDLNLIGCSVKAAAGMRWLGSSLAARHHSRHLAWATIKSEATLHASSLGRR